MNIIRLNISSMTTTGKQDVLFDDFSMLKQLIGQKELTLSPPNTNCDCVSHPSTSDYDDFDTHQITASIDKTN